MPNHHAPARPDPERDSAEQRDVARRTFLGYLIAGPTLIAAAQIGLAPAAEAAPLVPAPIIPLPPILTLPPVVSAPSIPEVYDLLDALRDAALPTANLIAIQVKADGKAYFAIPRSDNGQGITTSTQMIIAEEMNLRLDQVVVTSADARPELVFNQITGGSSTTFTTYTAIRVAAALAQGQLLAAAATLLGQQVSRLSAYQGIITAPGGGSASYGQLATLAAGVVTTALKVVLKPNSSFTVIGKPQTKTDALDIITGKKQFATDLQIPNALPTVICRAPDMNGLPIALANKAAVLAMPGVTDVVQVFNGIAVRAATFGQCIDAVRAMNVSWKNGGEHGENDDTILAQVKAAELPLVVPGGIVGDTVAGNFTFYFRSNSSLETNCAIADVRADRAEIWGPMKNPIAAQADIAAACGLPQTAVTVHVTQGGGSFGRKLFYDAALEAAQVSKAIGKPVKLMWTRADDSRQGRVHPMCTSRVQAVVTQGTVLSFEQRHTSIATQVNPGFGEALTNAVEKLPPGQYSISQSIYLLTQGNPYNFGVQTNLLNETNFGFNTASMRNIYSPDVATAREVMVDQIAAKVGKDPYQFRRTFTKQDRWRAALDRAASEAGWGKKMAPGTAQGIAMHVEYQGVAVCVVEIDCTPATVNRPIFEGVTGPRVTKVTYVVDVGLVINPKTIEAQMMGGINDGIAMTLTSSMHLTDGHFVEASWDNYFYTRQWNTPPSMKVIVIQDPAATVPGGVGEFGVAATCGAVACAYARATGKVPQYFPINHKNPLPFTPKPLVPPIPASPTDGLNYTY